MQITRAKVTSDDGFVIVNKDKGMTSHDVVSCMRKLCNTRKIGHGGTLDPMATGVLIVAVGRATKLLQYVTACRKSYRATVLLGVETVTDDATGEVVKRVSVNFEGLQEKLNEIYLSFHGNIMQIPSSVSAIKVGGRRAYDLVRKGEKFDLKAREVTIYSLEQLGSLRFDYENRTAEFDIEVTCSAGTYIRSIARDIGKLLGCGGHLTALERRSVGDFTLQDSVTLDKLNEFVAIQNTVKEPESVQVLPLVDMVYTLFPCVEVDEIQRGKIRVGNFLLYEDFLNKVDSNSVNATAFEGKSIYGAVYKGENITGSEYEKKYDKKLVALMTPKGKYVKPICVFDVGGTQ